MQMMTMRRVLLQEGVHHHGPNPCVHNSLHELSAATAQNATMACQHAYAYMHRRGGSPIPYLLAGLAAMLALIAISLFILACSYWKLVGCVEQHAAARAASNMSTNSASAAGPARPNSTPARPAQSTAYIPDGADPTFLDNTCSKLVVIMAGHDKPTFLAQPVGLVTLGHESTVASSCKSPESTKV